LLVCAAGGVGGGFGVAVDDADLDFGAHATASSVAAANAQTNDLTSDLILRTPFTCMM
jgi:hypothetical protein